MTGFRFSPIGRHRGGGNKKWPLWQVTISQPGERICSSFLRSFFFLFYFFFSLFFLYLFSFAILFHCASSFAPARDPLEAAIFRVCSVGGLASCVGPPHMNTPSMSRRTRRARLYWAPALWGKEALLLEERNSWREACERRSFKLRGEETSP